MAQIADSPVARISHGRILEVRIQRPRVRNCVDQPTARALLDAFTDFENDPEFDVAILHGAEGHFCAGADLKAVASGNPELANRIARDGPGPMGPTRLQCSKPVIAAISGYCVAGGLELACWCDLRVADDSAIFGVFCRRFGVPLIDGGTVRLPRLIGHSRAKDMILTGRAVDADEAAQMGLVNRRCATGHSFAAALQLAEQLADFPQTCLRGDLQSTRRQWSLNEEQAISQEFEFGLDTLRSGETVTGAKRFNSGQGRHGEFGSHS
jgi:enoyl-CoA hydratase